MSALSDASAPAGDGSALHAGYVSLCEILIDAPASVVWPHVLNTGSWIYDFYFEHVSGEIDGEGEIKYLWPAGVEVLGKTLTTAAQDRTLQNASVMKTLQIIPEKLWYGALLPKVDAGIRSIGVNLVVLHEVDGKTRVTAIRSKESMCPTEEICNSTQDSMRQYQPVAQFRWTEKYLPRLKELAEST